MEVIAIGDTVRVKGLVSKVEHNGKTGVVTEIKKSDGNAETRFGIDAGNILVKEENLELVCLGDESVGRLPATARQLAHYLSPCSSDGGEDGSHHACMLSAHSSILPLYYLGTYTKLRGVLDAQQPRSARERLALLQNAVRSTPTLSLVDPWEGSVKCVLLGSAEQQPRTASASEGQTFRAVLLAAAPNEPPRTITLPQRRDYLTMLADRLGNDGPCAMHSKYEGQVPKQPVLYFLLREQAAAPNPLASCLAGYAVDGDAILADVKLKDNGVLQCRDLPLSKAEAWLAGECLLPPRSAICMLTADASRAQNPRACSASCWASSLDGHFSAVGLSLASQAPTRQRCHPRACSTSGCR